MIKDVSSFQDLFRLKVSIETKGSANFMESNKSKLAKVDASLGSCIDQVCSLWGRNWVGQLNSLVEPFQAFITAMDDKVKDISPMLQAAVKACDNVLGAIPIDCSGVLNGIATKEKMTVVTEVLELRRSVIARLREGLRFLSEKGHTDDKRAWDLYFVLTDEALQAAELMAERWVAFRSIL